MSFGKRFLIFIFWSFLGFVTVQLILFVMAFAANALKNATILNPLVYSSLLMFFKLPFLGDNIPGKPLLLFLAISSLMSLISYKKTLRLIVGELIIGCVAISSGLLFILTLQKCGAGGGFACGVVWNMLLLIASAFWILAAGSISLFKFSSEKKSLSFFSKERLRFGFLSLLIIFVVGILSTSNLIRHGYDNSNRKTQQLNQMYADKSFAIFKPTYLPPIIDKNSRDESGVIGIGVNGTKEKAYFLTYYSSKSIVEYQGRKYKARLSITQGDFKGSDEERFQDDFTYQYDLIIKYKDDNGPHNYYKGDRIEKLTIKNYPAYYYFDNGIAKNGKLLLYREGTQIRMDSTNYNFSKEELIKIAESLERIN
ncbi:MAG: hypothetical protein Q8P26_05100 [Candidatus Levybacteria bacterium]|nr:hypothetical protein [Candidatus Levybacteria bacterium]